MPTLISVTLNQDVFYFFAFFLKSRLMWSHSGEGAMRS